MLAPGISIRGENYDKEFMLRENLVIPHDKIFDKKAYNLRSNELLLQQLQPVPVKPAVTLDQGIALLMYLRLISYKFFFIYGCN